MITLATILFQDSKYQENLVEHFWHKNVDFFMNIERVYTI